MKNKIYKISEISKIIDKKKKEGKKIVLCHGVFDLLHLGHISYFESSKKFGDILVVSLTPKKFVEKGLNRPIFSDTERALFLSYIQLIDYVLINNEKNATDVIKEVRPHFYSKGPDYKDNKKDITGQIKIETSLVKKFGGRVVFTNDRSFSSSNILNKIDNQLNENQFDFIKNLKKKNNIIKNLEKFENLKKLKVLIIGEIIIDKYILSEAIGKSGKEPHLVIKKLKEDIYLGGAGIIANHISSFCSKIDLISYLGEKKEYQKFIRRKLFKNVNAKFFYKKGSSTIEKKRYLDSISNTKVLGVYNLNDNPLNKNEEKLFKNLISKSIKRADLVIVSDYGHGLISKEMSEFICKNSKFLAVNTQINAFNIGYHSLKKYRNINFLIINEKELRYELREKDIGLEELILKTDLKYKINNLLVTRGKNGSIFYSKKTSKFFYCPAFATSVIDKVGAGDAMLSTVSPLIRENFDIDFSLLVGSLSAAQSVETLSNSSVVDKIKLLKYIKYMTK